jgi:hypothetical protein
VERIVRDLDAEQRGSLLVEDVPGVEAAVHPGREEDGWTGRTPTSVGKILGVRTKGKDELMSQILQSFTFPKLFFFTFFRLFRTVIRNIDIL